MLALGRASLDYTWGYDNGSTKHRSSLVGRPSVVKAEKCIITPCINEYRLQVRAGILITNAATVDFGTTLHLSRPDPVNIGLIGATCWQPSASFVYYPNPTAYQNWSNKNEFAFCQMDRYGDNIKSYLLSAFATNWTFVFEGGYTFYGPGTPYTASYAVPSNLQMVMKHNLSYVLSNIAASLTDYGLDIDNEIDSVIGQVVAPKVYVNIR